MESNDEAVFEVKKKPPDDNNTQKSFSLDDDELFFEKPSLFERLTSIFSRKRPIDDLDLDISPDSEEQDDFDDFPKPSFLQTLFGRFGKKSIDEDDTLF